MALSPSPKLESALRDSWTHVVCPSAADTGFVPATHVGVPNLATLGAVYGHSHRLALTTVVSLRPRILLFRGL